MTDENHRRVRAALGNTTVVARSIDEGLTSSYSAWGLFLDLTPMLERFDTAISGASPTFAMSYSVPLLQMTRAPA